MPDWTAIRRRAIGDRVQSVLPPRVRLPVLPLVATRFAQLAEDPEAEIGQFVEIVERDSGLTLDLLRHVNSSAFGMRQRVSTIRQAITTLGIQKCKLYLLSAALRRSIEGRRSRLIDTRAFSASNYERALLASVVATRLDADVDLAFTAAMVQDFLLPTVTDQLLPRYIPFTKAQPPVRLPAFEQETFGWNHTLAGASVLRDWGLPDDLVCCVYYHHHGLALLEDSVLGRTAAAAVAVSSLVPDPLTQEPEGLARLAELPERLPDFNLLEVAAAIDEEVPAVVGRANGRTTLLQQCQRFIRRGDAEAGPSLSGDRTVRSPSIA